MGLACALQHNLCQRGIESVVRSLSIDGLAAIKFPKHAVVIDSGYDPVEQIQLRQCLESCPDKPMIIKLSEKHIDRYGWLSEYDYFAVMPDNVFDENDGMPPQNEIYIKGQIHHLDTLAASAQSDYWREQFSLGEEDRLCLALCGGSTPDEDKGIFSSRDGQNFIEQVMTFAESYGCNHIALSNSRRTPESVWSEMLTVVELRTNFTWHIFDMHQSLKENFYPACVNVATAVIVSAESRSMACELSSIAVPTALVYPLDQKIETLTSQMNNQFIYDGNVIPISHPYLSDEYYVPGKICPNPAAQVANTIAESINVKLEALMRVPRAGIIAHTII
jgi:mitochondrial fission protein ELM1